MGDENCDVDANDSEIKAMERLHHRLGICLGFQVISVLVFQTAYLANTRFIPNDVRWDFIFHRTNELWLLTVPVILVAALTGACQFMDSPFLPIGIRLYGASIWILFLFSLLTFDTYNSEPFAILFYLSAIYSIIPELFLRRWLKRKLAQCPSP